MKPELFGPLLKKVEEWAEAMKGRAAWASGVVVTGQPGIGEAFLV
jgi:hypothetical protein